MPIHLEPSAETSLHNIVQATVTVLAVINPVICGTIFSRLTSKFASTQKRLVAIRVALAILIVLIASALIGLKALSIFGISLDVVRIVGGMIVAYMGFDMLRVIRRSAKRRQRMRTLLLQTRSLRSSCSLPDQVRPALL
jgi:small neutral amino acid transporter SnatA (MarC family)